MAGTASMSEEDMIAHTAAIKAEEARLAKEAELAAKLAAEGPKALGAAPADGYVRVKVRSSRDHFRAGRHWPRDDGDGGIAETVADVLEERLALLKGDRELLVEVVAVAPKKK